jgi:hypothetical protein
MDLKAVHVRHDQKRWVVQRLPVFLELIVGSLEVAVLLLVLPGEVPAHPNIGPPVPAARLLSALLKCVVGTVGVRVRRWHADHVAEVDEMFVGGGALSPGVGSPLGRELSGGH